MEAEVIELALKTPFGVLAVVATLLIALLFCSVQLFRYGPAIRKLNKIEVLSQLYHLAETQREMTRSFGEATAASNATRQATELFRTELDSLREFMQDAQEKMSEYNAENIMQSRLQEDEQSEEKGGFFHQFDLTAPRAETPDELFASMKSEWSKFVDAFKRRLEHANIAPQLNRMGKMTYMLTDKRRKNPLPVETADLITALHSQYRRHLALREISRQERDNLVQLIKTAIDELAVYPGQGETKLRSTERTDFIEAQSTRIN